MVTIKINSERATISNKKCSSDSSILERRINKFIKGLFKIDTYSPSAGDIDYRIAENVIRYIGGEIVSHDYKVANLIY